MKIIISGANETSYLLAAALQDKNDVTVIDDNDELRQEFDNLDITFIEGNGANLQVLEMAGVKSAKLFIACGKTDEANIVAAWTAKKVSGIITVAFVSKFEYFKSFNSKNNGSYLEEIGIDYVIWPEELLVQEIFRIITVPEAIDVEYFEGGKARLFEYRIKKDTPIINKELKNCSFPEDTIIVGITRDEELFIPDGATKLLLNDKAIFMGTEHALNILSRNYFFDKQSRVDSVAIIGGGNVGFMLAQKLESVGIRTKIIERDFERCEILSEKLQNTLVLHADGTDIKLLAEEVAESAVVVNVTNNDEKNLLCSLITKQLGVKRIITRVGNENIIALFEKVGVDVALSPKAATLDEIKNKIVDKSTHIIATVEQGKAEILELEVSEKIEDKLVKDIHFPTRAIIGIIKRGKRIIIPKGDTMLREGDSMIIFTKSDSVLKIKEFIKR
ncbi:MAG: Trk system potassium transporter TrkA [Candidatus Gastranaerophilales bacterium]|nr:Trk system potassium transporter TrkA [Candidatus Gastranaerophilales bacterium]